MMIHRVAFRCSWIESFACVLFDSFSSRNDIVMKRRSRNNCEATSSIDFIVVERLDFFSILFTFHVSKQFNLLTTRNSFWYFERQCSRYSRDFVLSFTNEQVHFFLFISSCLLREELSIVSITKSSNESFICLINVNTLSVFSAMKESRFTRRGIEVSTSLNDSDVSEREMNERLDIEELDEEDGLSEDEEIRRSVNERAVNERAVDERAADERAVNERAVNERAVNGRAVDGRAVDERDVNERDVNERDVNERDVNERDVNEQDE